jgi:hypothetical protein
MKNLLFIIAIVVFANNCFAKKNDTRRHKASKKLTYQNYINKYATDDTSKAIINLFFDKREAATDKMSITPITAAIGIIAPPIGISLTIISSPLLVSGVITKIKYNNSKLKKALINYHDNDILSSNLTKQVSKQLRIDRDNFNYLLAER